MLNSYAGGEDLAAAAVDAGTLDTFREHAASLVQVPPHTLIIHDY